MVAIGTLTAVYAIVALWRVVRRRPLAGGRWWLWSTIALAPGGVIAMEAGWIVTEVGRQPWVVYGVLRTSESVTPLGMLWIPFVAFTLVYLGLAAVVAAILRRQLRATTEGPP